MNQKRILNETLKSSFMKRSSARACGWIVITLSCEIHFTCVSKRETLISRWKTTVSFVWFARPEAAFVVDSRWIFWTQLKLWSTHLESWFSFFRGHLWDKGNMYRKRPRMTYSCVHYRFILSVVHLTIPICMRFGCFWLFTPSSLHMETF
jgi:hypothetical protein